MLEEWNDGRREEGKDGWRVGFRDSGISGLVKKGRRERWRKGRLEGWNGGWRVGFRHSSLLIMFVFHQSASCIKVRHRAERYYVLCLVGSEPVGQNHRI